ncbi:MAG TPA: hypothetical protein VFQ40_07465 [Actinomycetota bacterium]|nr:hypothetical protein [Actinomycetota bacterium]
MKIRCLIGGHADPVVEIQYLVGDPEIAEEFDLTYVPDAIMVYVSCPRCGAPTGWKCRTMDTLRDEALTRKLDADAARLRGHLG